MTLRCIISCLVLILTAAPSAYPQMKLVAKEKVMQVADPKLAPDSASLAFDFRTAVSDDMHEYDAPHIFMFKFVNAGEDSLKISRITTTCSCVRVKPLHDAIPPGASSRIEAVYDPKGHPGRFERRIFVYTGDNDLPSAVLRISVNVQSGDDLAGIYQVQKGCIRLRRDEVVFRQGSKAVEKIRFVNLSGKELKLECEEIFLPESMTFATRPEVLQDREEGEIVITYDPDGVEKEKPTVPLILKGLGVPPSQSTINIKINQ